MDTQVLSKMKKLYVIVLLVGVLLVTGCGKKENEVYKYSLDANPTTGYTWEYVMDKEGIVEVTKNEYVASNTDEDIAGASGKQEYEFKGLKEGDVTITFSYLRTWEENSAEKTEELKLHVDKDLNISKK